MDGKVEGYVYQEMVKILHLEGVVSQFIYDEKEKVLEFVIADFKWIGYDNFLDIMRRSLRHIFGNIEDLFEIRYEVGKEGRHNPDFILKIKLLIDLDTLAGYLRITERERYD